MTNQEERLDAWYDGSAICLIAKLELCLAQSQADAGPAAQGEN